MAMVLTKPNLSHAVITCYIYIYCCHLLSRDQKQPRWFQLSYVWMILNAQLIRHWIASWRGGAMPRMPQLAKQQTVRKTGATAGLVDSQTLISVSMFMRCSFDFISLCDVRLLLGGWPALCQPQGRHQTLRWRAEDSSAEGPVCSHDANPFPHRSLGRSGQIITISSRRILMRSRRRKARPAWPKEFYFSLI